MSQKLLHQECMPLHKHASFLMGAQASWPEQQSRDPQGLCKKKRAVIWCANHADGAQNPSELNKEVLASIEKLKRAAEKQPIPESKSGTAKQMPAALKPPIKAFAMAVMRQNEKQTDALKLALDAIMPVMAPYTNRQSLSVRRSLHASAPFITALHRCQMA